MAQARVTDYYNNRKTRSGRTSIKRKTNASVINQEPLFQPDLPLKKPKLDEEISVETKAMPCETTSRLRNKTSTRSKPAQEKVKQKSTRKTSITRQSTRQQGTLEKMITAAKEVTKEVAEVSHTNISENKDATISDINLNKIPIQKTPTKRTANSSTEQAPTHRKKAKDLLEEELTESTKCANRLKSETSSSVRKSLQAAFKDSTTTVSTIGDKTCHSAFSLDLHQDSSGETKESTKKEATSKAKTNTRSKKPTAAELKAKLAQCGKLDELQAVLAKVKEQAAQKPKATTKVKPVETKPVQKEGDKSEVVPAYIKYRHLATPAPPSLSLPFKYRTLEEMFHSMDTVISMLHNRNESSSFKKIKDAVQEMCRKTFQLRNLGQIKSVYPSSYIIYQQKKSQKISTKNEGGDYELMVDANLIETPESNLANPSSSGAMTTISNAQKGQNMLQKFTPSVLIARRTIFHNNLVDIVKTHHKNFLATLNPPMSVPDNKITRWHPKFGLDQVPEVEPAELPKPPHVEKYSTAKDVLEKARTMMNPRVAKALELVQSQKLKESPSTSAESKPSTSDNKETKQSKPKNGVSNDLLARIRAKEAHRSEVAMMRSEEDEKKIGMLERLPELCRILRGTFLTEKKAALTMEVAAQKLVDSYKSALSTVEVEKHINLMVEVLPEWLKIVQIRKEKYLKIDKTKEIKDLTTKINQTLKEQKNK